MWCGGPDPAGGGEAQPPDDFSPRPSHPGRAPWLEEGRQPCWGRRGDAGPQGLGQKVPLGAGREAAIRGTFCKDHKSLPESRLRGSVRGCHSQTQVRFWKTLSRWSPRPPVAAPDLSPGPLRALVSPPAVAPGAPPVLGNVCCVHIVLICGTSGKILVLPSLVAAGCPLPRHTLVPFLHSGVRGGPATPLSPGPCVPCSPRAAHAPFISRSLPPHPALPGVRAHGPAVAVLPPRSTAFPPRPGVSCFALSLTSQQPLPSLLPALAGATFLSLPYFEASFF